MSNNVLESDVVTRFVLQNSGRPFAVTLMVDVVFGMGIATPLVDLSDGLLTFALLA